MMNRHAVPALGGLLVLLLLGISTVSPAQETAGLITYGAQASTVEGDDDHLQVFFFHVPAVSSEAVYIRIFDADCGGVHDQFFGDPDTTIRYSLYGGQGAASAPSICMPHPDLADLHAGTLLKQEEHGVAPALDNDWYTFAALDPDDGEVVGDMRVFKLVVEGVSGDDGNVFNLAASLTPRRNKTAEGTLVQSYNPTIRLQGVKVAAEMRFTVPEGADELLFRTFDPGGARITYDTTFRSVELSSTDLQGTTAESHITVEPDERGSVAAVTFGVGGGEDPNDASFQVLGSAIGDGCPLPIELPVRFALRNHPPEPTLQTRPLADCFSQVLDATGTSDADGDLMQFDWDLGDGESDRGQQLVHRYDRPGTYHGVLRVTDTSGAVSNGALQPFTVVVNQAPKAEAGEDMVGEPGQELLLDGGGSSDGDGVISKYQWDFADGSPVAEGRTVRHTFSEPGKYLVSLRVEDDSDSPCNFASDYLTVWVNFTPVAVAGEDVICSVGEAITLDGARSYDTDGVITRYSWDFGDGSSGSGGALKHYYRQPGRYQVSLEVEDNAGALNSIASDQLTVLVNDPPVAGAGANKRVAVGEIAIFDASESFDRDGKIVSYTWDLGDGNTAQGRVIPYAYSAPGSYTVTLTVRDSSPAESGVGKDTIEVLVNAPPSASAGNDRVVTTSVVAFDGTTSTDPDGSILNYEWDFGDGTSASGATPTHVYTRPGMYAVTLRVKDDSGTPLNESIDRLLVVVNERPIADAGPDKITAPGEAVALHAYDSFDPDGEIIDYAWDFGDGSTASGRSVTHTYATPGVYTVRLMVSDDTEDPNAVDFDETVVTVNAAPTAIAGPDVLAAPGEEITFNGSASFDPDGDIASYEWRFSDGQGSASTAVTKRSFASPGTYTATLLIIDSSGAGNDLYRDSLTITVNHPPRAVPGPDVRTCSSAVQLDGSASIDPDGDALTYEWDLGDDSSKRGVMISHVYAEGGSFPVTLTVDDGTGLSNARSSAAMTVTINRPPNAEAGDDIQVCAGEVALFDGSASTDPEGGLLRYLWELGDGSTFEGVHPTKIYTEGGVYTITLTVQDDSGLECSSDTDQLTVRVAESPVAKAGPDVTVCANSRVRFDGTASRDFDGVVNRFLWDFGDGSSGGGSTPEHIFTEPGQFQVQLTVTGDQVGSCDNTDSDELMVTVLSAPVAVIAAPDRIPVGTATTFDGSQSSGEGSSILDWQWDMGDGTVLQGERVEHTYTKSGRYVANLRITTDAEVTCGSVETQRTVIANQGPVAEAGEPQLVGVNQPVLLNGGGSHDDDGAVVSYHWDLGDGNTADGVVTRHWYRTSGTYRVVLTVSDDAGLSNSTATDTVEITVNSAPLPVIDVAPSACAGEEVLFSAASSSDADGEIASYHWTFGDGQSADGAEVSHFFARPGRYNVTLAADDGLGVSNSRQETAISFPVNQPPTVLAGPDVNACSGEEVVLSGSGSSDLDGRVEHFHWDLGDGSEAEGETVRHTYAAAGRYQATLTAVDDLGGACGTGSDSVAVRINTRPVAEAGPDMEAYVGGAHDEVLFDGTGSSDADGDPLTYLWDFGDGGARSGPKVFYAFTQPGRYTVRLTVRDGSGTSCGEATDQLTVTVSKR